MILEIPARPLDFATTRERSSSWGQRDVFISRLDGVKNEKSRRDGLTKLVLSCKQHKSKILSREDPPVYILIIERA